MCKIDRVFLIREAAKVLLLSLVNCTINLRNKRLQFVKEFDY